MCKSFQIDQNRKSKKKRNELYLLKTILKGFFPQILQILQIRQHPITYDLIYLGKFMGTNLQINQS